MTTFSHRARRGDKSKDRKRQRGKEQMGGAERRHSAAQYPLFIIVTETQRGGWEDDPSLSRIASINNGKRGESETKEECPERQARDPAYRQ